MGRKGKRRDEEAPAEAAAAGGDPASVDDAPSLKKKKKKSKKKDKEADREADAPVGGGEGEDDAAAAKAARKAARKAAKKAAKVKMQGGEVEGGDDSGGADEAKAGDPVGMEPPKPPKGAGAGGGGAGESGGGSLRGISRGLLGGDDEKERAKVERLREQAAAGKKLSNKQRKLVAKWDEKEAVSKELEARDLSGLGNFTVTAAGKDTDVAAAALEGTRDVIIDAFSISTTKKPLFVDAELRIVHGRRYGIVGPNGQGKTTLLKHIAARALPIPPNVDVLYVEQEVEADETPAFQSVMKADVEHYALMEEERALVAELELEGDGTVEPEDEEGDAAAAAAAGDDDDEGEGEGGEAVDLVDPRDRRLTEIYEKLDAMGGIEDRQARARKILSGLGFTVEMQERETYKFSGGWRMRISLARALYVEPTLLLLDEPTNHLDINAVIWLDDYLQKWKNTLLIVSHDQDFLNSVVTDIIHLDLKKLFYYRGDFEAFKVMMLQQKRKNELDWIKQEKQIKAAKRAGKSSKQAETAQKKKREAGASKARKKNREAGMAGAEETKSALIERPRDYIVNFVFPTPPELTPPVLQVQEVSFHYRVEQPLFKKLDFGVDMDSRICIVGPNGAGKSTLLNLLMDEIVPMEGEITRNRFLRIGRYNQHFMDVLPMDKSPVEYLRSLVPSGEPALTIQDARQLLGKFGLEGHAHMIKSRDLSGGQKARVVFASMSILKPHIMFFDEPTNHLDMESIDALIDGIAAFDGGVVLVTHDARLITALECVLWVVNDPSVVRLIERTSAEHEVLDLHAATSGDDEWRTRLRGLSTGTTFKAGDPCVVEWMAGFDRYREFLLEEMLRQEREEDIRAAARKAARQEALATRTSSKARKRARAKAAKATAADA